MLGVDVGEEQSGEQEDDQCGPPADNKHKTKTPQRPKESCVPREVLPLGSEAGRFQHAQHEASKVHSGVHGQEEHGDDRHNIVQIASQARQRTYQPGEPNGPDGIHLSWALERLQEGNDSVVSNSREQSGSAGEGLQGCPDGAHDNADVHQHGGESDGCEGEFIVLYVMHTRQEDSERSARVVG